MPARCVLMKKTILMFLFLEVISLALLTSISIFGELLSAVFSYGYIIIILLFFSTLKRLS